MFAMTVYKCTTTLLAYGPEGLLIVRLFLRDGVFWFVAIFVTFLPEIVIWASARASLAEIMIAPGLAVTSIIGSRVLLNIKSLGKDKMIPATSPPMLTSIELDSVYPSRAA